MLTNDQLMCWDSGQLLTGGNVAMYGVEMMGGVLRHVPPSISGFPSCKFTLEVHTSTSKNSVTINNKLQFEYLMKTNAIDKASNSFSEVWYIVHWQLSNLSDHLFWVRWITSEMHRQHFQHIDSRFKEVAKGIGLVFLISMLTLS